MKLICIDPIGWPARERLAFAWRTAALPARAAACLLAAAFLAPMACDDDDGICCFVEIRPSAEDRISGIAGPDDVNVVLYPGDTIVWHGSLTDSAGLAGLEIEVLGHQFAAADFSGAWLDGQQVSVGPSGRLHVLFSLRDRGQVVAGGVMSWTLQPRINWLLRITRGPADGPCPETWWCDVDVLTLPIADGFVNYPGEAVWLMLTGGKPPWNGHHWGDKW